MSLATIESAVRGGLETVVADISQKVTALRPHLEELATMADKAEQSPLVQAALTVALGPELEQKLADIILAFDKTVNGTGSVTVPVIPVVTPPVVTPPVAPVG